MGRAGQQRRRYIPIDAAAAAAPAEPAQNPKQQQQTPKSIDDQRKSCSDAIAQGKLSRAAKILAECHFSSDTAKALETAYANKMTDLESQINANITNEHFQAALKSCEEFSLPDAKAEELKQLVRAENDRFVNELIEQIENADIKLDEDGAICSSDEPDEDEDGFVDLSTPKKIPPLVILETRYEQKKLLLFTPTQLEKLKKIDQQHESQFTSNQQHESQFTSNQQHESQFTSKQTTAAASAISAHAAQSLMAPPRIDSAATRLPTSDNPTLMS